MAADDTEGGEGGGGVLGGNRKVQVAAIDKGIVNMRSHRRPLRTKRMLFGLDPRVLLF